MNTHLPLLVLHHLLIIPYWIITRKNVKTESHIFHSSLKQTFIHEGGAPWSRGSILACWLGGWWFESRRWQVFILFSTVREPSIREPSLREPSLKEPSVNRKDLHALTLVGPPRDSPEIDPLAVLQLDNWLGICEVTLEIEMVHRQILLYLFTTNACCLNLNKSIDLCGTKIFPRNVLT